MPVAQRRPYTAELQAPHRHTAAPVSLDSGLPAAEMLAADAAGTNGHADAPTQAAIAEVVAELKSEIHHLRSELRAATSDEVTLSVRREIGKMIEEIKRAKLEVAAIQHPSNHEDRPVARAFSELDATVAATETATNDILQAAETIEGKVRRLHGLCATDEEAVLLCDGIGADLISIMEACNFQDITGQRITKVIRTLKFVEERVRAIVGIWGPEGFAELMPTLSQAMEEEPEDAHLLNGPSLEGEGISQDDIDALFD